MRNLVSEAQAPPRIRARSDGADPKPRSTVASGLIVTLGLAAVLLLLIGIELLAPLPVTKPLSPFPMPAAVLEAQSPADLAASAADTVLARPLFAVTRRPVASPSTGRTDLAGADRISGVILEPGADGDQTAIAVMQPKDGGKPVTLRVGDRFRGARITVIDAAGITLAGGIRINPQFGPTAAVQATAAR